MNNNSKTNSLSGFYKLNRADRLERLRHFCGLDDSSIKLLSSDSPLKFELSNLFVENAIGQFSLPLGLVTNVHLNSKEYCVPFAVEESSVIAASSNAAKWIKASGGFSGMVAGNEMIGQIQLLDLVAGSMEDVRQIILNEKTRLLKIANDVHPRLTQRGGGARDIVFRPFPNAATPFAVVHVHIDTCEAMGANLVNTVCEELAPHIQALTGARIGLKILSNYATERLFKVQCKVDPKLLAERGQDNGAEVAAKICEATDFANSDPHRAATHNKGVMNGVDPVLIATGNDWRANEAGIHAYACKQGSYGSLSAWQMDEDGWLIGEIEAPMQIGTVGGITRLHPMAQKSLDILGRPSSNELAQIALSTGLASNLAALRALVTTGIQAGHMKLHAKNLALSAGALGHHIEEVASEMVRNNKVSQTEAERLVKTLNCSCLSAENGEDLPSTETPKPHSAQKNIANDGDDGHIQSQ
jgi:hydroxymethylglutaryl-CoA reductase